MVSSRRSTYLLGALSLATLISAGAIPTTNPLRGISGRTATITERDGDPWPYAVLGDSWGSGVAWKDDVLYDNNQDSCLRSKEAHGPQMAGDNQWSGFQKSTLRDAACSGSDLRDIVKGGNQIGKVGNPNVLVMTSGASQAGFGNIVKACIYHPNPSHNYGPAYKDDNNRIGDCAKALDDALSYITDPNKMENDLRLTIDDVFNDPAVKDNSNFLLYITGYAQFFGTDLSEVFNNENWNIPGVSPTPYLSKELRQTFNDRVTKVNDLYRKVTEDPKYSKQVRYVDLDPHFDRERFCEPWHTTEDLINPDPSLELVAFWNLNYFPGQGVSDAVVANGSIYLSPQEAQAVWGNGEGVTAWSGSGGNTAADGWRLRAFHPRPSGYARIKDAIFAQMTADGLPAKQAASGGLTASQVADQACALPLQAGNVECANFCSPGSTGVCVESPGPS